MKTLSVTIICKDEEDNLVRLLPKLTFANQVVVTDTGSADGSADVAHRYADVCFYKWRDDFSKARNYCLSKATGDYVMWLDADDDLPTETIDCIKNWLADDRQCQDFVYLKYRMGESSQFWFWRERIIRKCPECRFKGFIHEAIPPFGQVHYLNCDVIHVSRADHSQRNLDIYRKALSKGRRFTLRDKFYYARTLADCGLYDEALPILVRFCSNERAYAADRTQGYKMLARNCIKNADCKQAAYYLSKSVAILPPDSEVCCLFGDVEYLKGNYLYATRWYEYALTSRMRVGFVNDYYQTFYPNVQLSVCWWRLGDFRQAKFYHKTVKALYPDNETVLSNDKWFV
ncbi:MAG: glycosyltransferase [Firmicutes bacterium]|nr:glycosyltransferase [Bacillota bacterium]